MAHCTTTTTSNKKALSASRSVDIDQCSNFNEADIIKGFGELKNKICDKMGHASFCVVQSTDASITLQSMEFVPDTGIPKFLLIIKQDFSYQSFYCGIKINIVTLSANRCHTLNRWSQIEECIRFLKSQETPQKKLVMQEQIRAMGSKKVVEKKYEPATLVRAFEYHALSRSAYQRIRIDFELPSVRTLSTLTSSIRNIGDNKYLSNFFSGISENQKNCILLIDEVYVKPTLQCHGGVVFGKAVNKPDLTANTILSFMIVCLFNGPKLLYKMLPVKQLDATFLHRQTDLILKQVERAGGRAKAVICDNNRVNQSFFKLIQGDVPWQTKDKVYLLFDFVHFIKNIRNNWLTEKTKELIFHEGDEPKTASWTHLENLLHHESQSLVKMSKLSKVALYPTPIERQKVSYCLMVFCEKTLNALRCHPELSNAKDTALFIEKVLQFWKIVNVKSPYENVRMRDDSRAVIEKEDDPNLLFLLKFGDMALKMSSSEKPRKKCLTKDTSQAIWHTCNGLVDLARHLLTTTHQFVMLGLFTTDHLEKQFGKLRQGSGGTYFITAQQVMEKWAIHKAKIYLRDVDNDMLVFEKSISSGHACEKCNFYLNEDLCTIFDLLPELEMSLSDDVKMTLVYIAGYVSRHEDNSHEGYFAYYKYYGSYLQEHNRGGLKIPRDCICQWVIFAYILFHEVADLTYRKS